MKIKEIRSIVVFVSILVLAIIPFALILWVPGPDIQRSGTFKEVNGQMVFADIVDHTPAHPMAPYAFFCVIVGWLIFFTGIFQMHKVLQKMESSNYPISPVQSLILQIFPFYNFYGVFKWTNTLIHFLNENCKTQFKTGIWGFFLLIALLLAFIGSLPPGAVLSHSFALMISASVYLVLANRVNRFLLRKS